MELGRQLLGTDSPHRQPFPGGPARGPTAIPSSSSAFGSPVDERPARGRPAHERGGGGVARLARRRAARLGGWPFPADDERRLWYYTPTDHGGLPLSAMRPAQQRHAMQLVGHGLVTGGVRDGVDDHRFGERSRHGSKASSPSSSASGATTPGSTTSACSAFPTRDGTWAWRFRGTTSRSTTPSSGARWSDRHHASSAPTRHRRRCSARTCCGRSPVPRTWRGELVHSLDGGSGPPRSCLRLPRSTSSPRIGPTCPRGTIHCHSPTSGDDASTVTWAAHGGGPAGGRTELRAAARAPGRGPLHQEHRRASPPPTSGPTNANSSAPSSTCTSTGSPTNWRTWRSRSTGPTTSSTAVVRLGGRHRARPASLLPGPGPAPARRIRQHPARRQPRPHGVARSRIGFRWRRPRPALRPPRPPRPGHGG